MLAYYYPLKTRENLWFSDVFMGYQMGTMATNGLNFSVHYYSYSGVVINQGVGKGAEREGRG